jgi:hypothetical protein
MKTRLLWIAVVLAACAGFYFAMVKPALYPSLPSVTIDDLKKMRPPPPLPPPTLPQPIVTEPVISPPQLPSEIVVPPVRGIAERPVVPIQNGTTIDFSSGGPLLKNQGKDDEALQQALREMAEAVKNMQIEPAKKSNE